MFFLVQKRPLSPPHNYPAQIHTSIQEYFTPFLQMTLPLEAAAPAAKSLQSCPNLCDPIDGSPSGSPVHGIFQARVLECFHCLLQSKSLQTINAEEGAEEKEPSYTVGGNAN